MAPTEGNMFDVSWEWNPETSRKFGGAHDDEALTNNVQHDWSSRKHACNHICNPACPASNPACNRKQSIL